MDMFDYDLWDSAGLQNMDEGRTQLENIHGVQNDGPPTDSDLSRALWLTPTSTSADEQGYNDVDWRVLTDMVDSHHVEEKKNNNTGAMLPSARSLLHVSSESEEPAGLAQTVGRGGYNDATLIINPANDFGNVPEWLSGSYRPPAACTYCRHRRLQCLVIRTSEVNPNPVLSCTSCVALFRECSLSGGEKRRPSGFETVTPVYGQLHGVTEEEASTHPPKEEVDGAGIITGPSYTKPDPDDAPGRKPSFSRKGGRVLRNWFHQHQHHPYPTDEEKTLLAYDSGLSKRQVLNWFANARRRHKQNAMPLVSGPGLRSGSPMPAPSGLALMMTPMERWRRSPPEHEAVPESAILDAITTVPFDSLTSQRSTDMTLGDRDVHLRNAAEEAGSSSQLGSSVSSFGTGLSGESSGSVSSAWSYQSGEASWPFPLLADSVGGGRRRHHRRRRRTPVTEHRYQCTFCPFSFKKKHDWCRHEKSVHLSLESWICTPTVDAMRQIGQSQSDGSQRASKCSLCDKPSPSASHWEDMHDFEICAERPLADRTFARKDHLWQHLQKFHHCQGGSIPPHLARHLERLCRSDANEVCSRCGFCDCRLQTWDGRADHLAGHFKNGRRMHQWTGDWGLDLPVLRELREAVLPTTREYAFVEG
jgi:hypothetical protein